MTDSDTPAFYRDRLNVSQRRRAETLILVKTLWDHIQPADAQKVAEWVYSGQAKVVPPTALAAAPTRKAGAR